MASPLALTAEAPAVLRRGTVLRPPRRAASRRPLTCSPEPPDFRELREYVLGDDLRRIDWIASRRAWTRHTSGSMPRIVNSRPGCSRSVVPCGSARKDARQEEVLIEFTATLARLLTAAATGSALFRPTAAGRPLCRRGRDGSMCSAWFTAPTAACDSTGPDRPAALLAASSGMILQRRSWWSCRLHRRAWRDRPSACWRSATTSFRFRSSIRSSRDDVSGRRRDRPEDVETGERVLVDTADAGFRAAVRLADAGAGLGARSVRAWWTRPDDDPDRRRSRGRLPSSRGSAESAPMTLQLPGHPGPPRPASARLALPSGSRRGAATAAARRDRPCAHRPEGLAAGGRALFRRSSPRR